MLTQCCFSLEIILFSEGSAFGMLIAAACCKKILVCCTSLAVALRDANAALLLLPKSSVMFSLQESSVVFWRGKAFGILCIPLSRTMKRPPPSLKNILGEFLLLGSPGFWSELLQIGLFSIGFQLEKWSPFDLQQQCSKGSFRERTLDNRHPIIKTLI